MTYINRIMSNFLLLFIFFSIVFQGLYYYHYFFKFSIEKTAVFLDNYNDISFHQFPKEINIYMIKKLK